MINKQELPNKISIFPLDNFIIFPKTSVPLNIFEPRYIDMINDSMRTNKLIGMIQPKNLDNDGVPVLHDIGCLGKITSFKETDDGRYLIELRGIIRFQIVKEIHSQKRYRECEISYNNYYNDLNSKSEVLKFSDL
jgi:Lon protease-like protein